MLSPQTGAVYLPSEGYTTGSTAPFITQMGLWNLVAQPTNTVRMFLFEGLSFAAFLVPLVK